MPEAYTQIRDKFIRMGDSEKEAKTRAAKIFNARIAPKTGQPFVTGKSEGPKRPPKK
jgi:hypothetical protein